MGRNAGHGATGRRDRWRRTPLLAVVLVVLGVVGTTPAHATDPEAVPPTTIGVTSGATPTGPAPHWATVSHASPSSHAAVAGNGTTYLASPTRFAEVHAHQSSSVIGDDVVGPGVISGPTFGSPPLLAVDGEEGNDVMAVAGQVVGSVTIGSPLRGQVTIDGGAGSSFVGRFDESGSLAWVHVFGPGTTTARGVEVVGGTVVVVGDLDGALTVPGLDGVTGAGDAFILGIDADQGDPAWLTTIEGAGAPGTSVDITDTTTSTSVIALVAIVPGGATVHGTTTTTSGSCANPSFQCDALLALDPASGEPVLTTVLESHARYTVAIAATDDGFALVRHVFPFYLGDPDQTEVVRISNAGAQLWSRSLAGAEARDGATDVVVDRNGDVIVATAYTGTVRIGSEPGATTVSDGGSGGILVVEYDRDGVARQHIPVTGVGADHEPLVTVAVDPVDAIRLIADSADTSTTTIGSGPGAKTVIGPGAWVASFPAEVAAASTFVPMSPVRVLDTRTANDAQWGGPLAAGTPQPLWLDGRPDVGYTGFDTTAWVFNVTVTGVTEPTFVTVWPFGQAQPLASNLNLLPGETRANQVTVRLGFQRSVQFATSNGSAHVVVDLVGRYEANAGGDAFHQVTPTRVLDSRTANTGFAGKIQPFSSRNLVIAGPGVVPAGATAVLLSVTAAEVEKDTFLRVTPTGTTSTSSSLNVRAGETLTGFVTARIGTGGAVTFTNNAGATHVVADVVGYYGDGSGGAWFRPVDPTRVLDSRFGTGGHSTPWGQGTDRTVPVAGGLAASVTVTGLSGNLTATGASTLSLATVYAGSRPPTSNLLFAPGQTVAAGVASGVSGGRTVSIYNQLGTAHFVLDVNGYFTAP